MLALIIIFICIIIISLFIVLLRINETKPKKEMRLKSDFWGRGWTCGQRGCKPNEYGEFASKKDCETVCKSFVNNGFGCKLILGVPWNSYSTAKTCKKHS